MIDRLFGEIGIASPRSGRALGWLRDALAALPEPWIVLASRRRSGADGPPWVRYVVLHPAKGIALVDVDPTELAVAPLEEFFDHTGLAAFQSDALPIVAVTLPKDGSAPVADALEAAFTGFCCHLGNRYWCEAVVELLLTTPELKLTRLPRRILPVPPVATPEARVVVPPTTQPSHAIDALPVVEPPAAPHAPSLRVDEPKTANERWLLGSQSLPSRRTWRSWPTLPVTAAATLLAIVVVLLASPPALPPNEMVANSPHPRVTAAASAALETVPPLTMAAVSPSATDRVASPNPPTPSTSVSAPLPPAPKVSASVVAPPPPPARPAPHQLAQRPPVSHYAAHPTHRAPPPPSAPQEQSRASAGAPPATACADVLHPDRPGGWQYHGPPVPNCLPIRFFGLIGMR